MSAKHPPRYTERFIIEFNRGGVRIMKECEIEIDLSTIRRCMGLRAVTSMGRKSQARHVKVRVLGDAGIVGKATSHRMEVAIG